MRIRLIHLTDPHLSTLAGVKWWTLRGKRCLGYLSWRLKRRHHLRADVLAEVTVAAAAEGADLAVVTGDLVHIGLPHELASARAWLDTLAMTQPVLLVPGNHDCYREDSYTEASRLLVPYTAGAGGAVPGEPSLVRLGDVAVIGLWTARPMPWWSAGGWLGAAQLEALDRLLATTQGTFRCVLLHHAPLAEQARPRKALAETAALCEVLARHGVELVLHGHLHHNDERAIAGRTRVIVTAPASSAVADNPAAYRVLDIDTGDTDWRVHMALKTRDAAGTMVPAAHADYRWSRLRAPFNAGD